MIGLIRHGITDWNIAGKAQGLAEIPLNREGKEQALKLAAKLQDQQWELIIHSPLSRAVETSCIIADLLGIAEQITDHRLQEMDCGLIEGMTELERTEQWGEAWRTLDLGLETTAAAAERGALVLEEISSQ